MESINGVFDQQDAALRAGERAREVIRVRSNVRVYLSGKGGTLVESEILSDKKSAVTGLALALAVSGAVLIGALSRRWPDMFIWLLGAAALGAMLALWFTGEMHRPRTFAMTRLPKTRFELEVRAGRAIVTALVDSHDEARRVTHVFESAGGHVVNELFAKASRHDAAARQ